MCLIFLLVAVSHADALQPVSGLDSGCGFLHRQPVVDGLVALVVQRAVQDALQPEVTVGLLLVRGWRGWRDGGVEIGKRRREGKTESILGMRRAGGGGCRSDKSGKIEAQGRVFYVSDREGRLRHPRGFYLQSEAIIIPRLVAFKLNSHVSVH